MATILTIWKNRKRHVLFLVLRKSLGGIKSSLSWKLIDFLFQFLHSPFLFFSLISELRYFLRMRVTINLRWFSLTREVTAEYHNSFIKLGQPVPQPECFLSNQSVAGAHFPAMTLVTCFCFEFWLASCTSFDYNHRRPTRYIRVCEEIWKWNTNQSMPE